MARDVVKIRTYRLPNEFRYLGLVPCGWRDADGDFRPHWNGHEFGGSSGSGQTIDALQERGQAIRAVHAADQIGGAVQIGEPSGAKARCSAEPVARRMPVSSEID